MLTVTQDGRNPTQKERQILTLLAAGDTRAEAAHHAGLKLRAVTAIIEGMRDRYAPTLPALMVLAVKLQWIETPITISDPKPPTPHPHHQAPAKPR
jgi:hypothetical protein